MSLRLLTSYVSGKVYRIQKSVRLSEGYEIVFNVVRGSSAAIDFGQYPKFLVGVWNFLWKMYDREENVESDVISDKIILWFTLEQVFDGSQSFLKVGSRGKYRHADWSSPPLCKRKIVLFNKGYLANVGKS